MGHFVHPHRNLCFFSANFAPNLQKRLSLPDLPPTSRNHERWLPFLSMPVCVRQLMDVAVHAISKVRPSDPSAVLFQRFPGKVCSKSTVLDDSGTAHDEV